MHRTPPDPVPPATHRRRLVGAAMLLLVAVWLAGAVAVGGIGGATVHGPGFATPPPMHLTT